MELDSGILLKELSDLSCFVGGEIIKNDMNLLPGWAVSYNFFEKCDEILALVWRAVVLPCTRPVAVSRAA